jgi:hypothetical protein
MRIIIRTYIGDLGRVSIAHNRKADQLISSSTFRVQVESDHRVAALDKFVKDNGFISFDSSMKRFYTEKFSDISEL